MRYNYHTVIIGAGLAGASLAKTMALHHAKVLLIEEETFGGNHLGISYTESKLFVKHSRKNMLLSGQTDRYQNTYFDCKHDIEKYKTFFSYKELIKLGAEFKQGKVHLLNKNHLMINKKKISFKNLVLATGTRNELMSSDQKVIKDEMLFAKKHIWDEPKIFKSILIKGLSVQSLEIAQAFVNLGTKVYVLELKNNFIEKHDSEYFFALKDYLKKMNVEFFGNGEIKTALYINNINDIEVSLKFHNVVRTLNVSKIYVVPKVKANGNLLKSDFEIAKDKEHFYITDLKMKVKNTDNIFAIGSGVIGYQYESNSIYHAEIVANHLLKKSGKTFNFYERTLQVDTNEEFVFFGMNEEDLEKEQIKYNAFDTIFENDLAIIYNQKQQGRVKMYFDKKHRVLGFSLLASNCKDIADFLKFVAYNKISVKKILKTEFTMLSNLKIIYDFFKSYYYEHIETDDKRENDAKRKLNY